MSVRQVTVTFLAAEGLGAAVWGLTLLLVPETRVAFTGPGASVNTLLAFCVPDLLLYVGAAWLAAIGVAGRHWWGWSILCLHSGAAIYASLYALSLALFTGCGWWGAWLMLPSLVCLPLLLWRLRPGKSPC